MPTVVQQVSGKQDSNLGLSGPLTIEPQQVQNQVPDKTISSHLVPSAGQVPEGSSTGSFIPRRLLTQWTVCISPLS